MQNLSILPQSVYPLANMPYQDQLNAKNSKIERILGKYGKITPIKGMSEPVGYRNSLTAHFGRGKNGKLVTGDYNPRSGRVFAVEEYPLHRPELEKAMDCVRAAANFCKYEAYNAESGKGMVRGVALRYSKKQKQVMVVLVTGKAILPGAKNFVSKVRTLCQNQNVNVSTVVQNVNDLQTNILLGEREKVLFGKGFLVDEFCGKTFALYSTTFYPVNSEQSELLYENAIKNATLTGNETLLHIYSGMGALALACALKTKDVFAVDTNEASVQQAMENAKHNKLTNVHLSAENPVEWLERQSSKNLKPDVIIIEPPKTALQEALMNSILQLKAKKVIYLSTRIEDQATDIETFIKNGYRMKNCDVLDIFPHTNYIACAILLEKT